MDKNKEEKVTLRDYTGIIFHPPQNRRRNFLSIKKANKCLFSRRNGYVGKIFYGYSVVLNIFGFKII